MRSWHTRGHTTINHCRPVTGHHRRHHNGISSRRASVTGVEVVPRRLLKDLTSSALRFILLDHLEDSILRRYFQVFSHFVSHFWSLHWYPSELWSQYLRSNKTLLHIRHAARGLSSCLTVTPHCVYDGHTSFTVRSWCNAFYFHYSLANFQTSYVECSLFIVVCQTILYQF
jgi:hypothetical protein